jgi:transposase
VYWKPIYNLLEGDFEMLVVNAHHLKTVPGRKTDVKDAEWIADLLQHGLLRASFIPAAPQRELRDLTRYRTRLVEERAREINRLQKTLEDTNLKLGDVVSDVMGKAARMILSALVEGESDPARLAAFALGRVQASEQELVAALTGSVSAHHRFLLGEHLTQIEHLDKAIERVTQELGRRFTPPDPHTEQPSAPQPLTEVPPPSQDANTTSEEPALTWAEAVTFLSSIPGVSERAAQGILAEIGLDMQRFHSAQHLASWAGVVRCITHFSIPGTARKNSKGGSWVNGLPCVERQREQEHATESGRKPEDAYGNVPQDPRNRVRARLPEVQFPIGGCPHPSLQRLRAMSPHGVNSHADTPPFREAR